MNPQGLLEAPPGSMWGFRFPVASDLVGHGAAAISFSKHSLDMREYGVRNPSLLRSWTTESTEGKILGRIWHCVISLP